MTTSTARNMYHLCGPQSPHAVQLRADDFKHIAPSATASRSPCPALNTLANHGFISRTGRNLRFGEVVQAINHVYNLSHPFCILLAFGGFITCGNLRIVVPRSEPSHIHEHQPCDPHSNKSVWSKLVDWTWGALNFLTSLYPVSWTLDLERLSQRGFFKITHNASLVHANNVPSTAPDPKLLADFLAYKPRVNSSSSQPPSFQLIDIAKYHALRVDASHPKPKRMHERIALGECALTFLVLREKGRSRVGGDKTTDGAVSVHHLEQWFGQERLPDGWWDEGACGLRPRKAIKISDARGLAFTMGQLGKTGVSRS